MNETELLQEISHKLTALLALTSKDTGHSLTATILMLDRVGLSSGDIAKILDTTKGTVDVTKSRSKSKNGKQQRK